MKPHDDVAAANQRLWENEVEKGCGYTVPWLDLDVALLRAYAAGKLAFLPEPYTCMYPASILAGVTGKNVLCLASGGGQQSAIFGLLGARVTVVDLSDGQLAGDRRAAAHYGYDVTTIHADMRDLSSLNEETFDLVFQANSMAYVPEIREVYDEVARVLRLQGLYRVVIGNPATARVAWNGAQYCIEVPYNERVKHRVDGGIEFRHYVDAIFNGLLDSGLSIQRVQEAPYTWSEATDAPPGSWDHERAYVGGEFAIIARRESTDRRSASDG